MLLGVSLVLSLVLLESEASEGYTCPTDRQCISHTSCHHKGTPIWCNDEHSEVCCPKRSSGDHYKSETSGTHYKPDKSYSKSEKSYSKPEKSYSKPEKSYSKSEKSYSKPKFERDYRGGRDYYALDFYEDGYSGPGLSHEAKRVLQSYDEKECGVRRSFYGRISTGHEIDLGITKYGEFPWQAAILLKIDNHHGGHRQAYKFLCGATVVNPVLIITAAHCIKGMRISSLKVKLGEWNLRGTQGEMFPTINRKIRKVILHNYYNSASLEHDIALLVLSKPVNLRRTPHVAPICIPPKHTKFDEYSKCYITGYGNDIYKPNYGSNILKVASVSLLKDDCRHKLKESIPSLSNNFFKKTDLRCITGSFGKDACVGDGGGAVVCPISNSELSVCKGGYSCKEEHYFLAGIISWGSDKCGQDDSVTVITDFDSHRDWIAEKARPYGGIDSYYDFDHGHYDSYDNDGHDYDGYDDYGNSDYGYDDYGSDYNRNDRFRNNRYRNDRYDSKGYDDYGNSDYNGNDRYDNRYDYGNSDYNGNGRYDNRYDDYGHSDYDRNDYNYGRRDRLYDVYDRDDGKYDQYGNDGYSNDGYDYRIENHRDGYSYKDDSSRHEYEKYEKEKY